MDETNHSEEQHKLRLHKLCRICAEPVEKHWGKLNKKSNYVKRRVADYKNDIFKYFALDVSNDVVERYPLLMCHLCYMKIVNIKKQKSLSPASLQNAQQKAATGEQTKSALE